MKSMKAGIIWGIALAMFMLLGAEKTANVYAVDNDVFTVSATRVGLRPEQKKSLSIQSTVGIGRIDIESSDEAVVSVDKAAVFVDLNAVEVGLTAGKVGTATIALTTSNFAIVGTEGRKNVISQTVAVTVTEDGDSDVPDEPGSPGSPDSPDSPDSPGKP